MQHSQADLLPAGSELAAAATTTGSVSPAQIALRLPAAACSSLVHRVLPAVQQLALLNLAAVVVCCSCMLAIYAPEQNGSSA
jgi:hypothetical protein